MAGQPSIETTRQFGSRMKNSRTRPYIWDSVSLAGNVQETLAINSNTYPMKPLPKDPFDDRWEIISNLSGPNPRNANAYGGAMINPARPKLWTDEEIEYLKRKKDAEEYAAYNSWISTKYPIHDPANRELLKRIVPRYFETRKQNLEESIALQSKYAKLRLLGPESEEDLKLEWEVETERKVIPKGPFHDPMQWMINEYNIDTTNMQTFTPDFLNGNRRGYEQGLFNPFGFLTVRNAPYMANAANMSDIRGDNRARVYGPLGVRGPPDQRNYNTNYGGPELGQDNLNRGPDQQNLMRVNRATGVSAGRFTGWEPQIPGTNPGAQYQGN